MILSAGKEATAVNVLEKSSLLEALKLQMEIVSTPSVHMNETSGMNDACALTDLCTKAGGSCASSFAGVCQCLVVSILKQWNCNSTLLELDQDCMSTLQACGKPKDLQAVLGNAIFDSDGVLVTADALSVACFLQDRTIVENGNEIDPINEQWELDAFLTPLQSAPTDCPQLEANCFSTRSFSDEFGDAIAGDLALVQVSCVVTFVFLGATLGQVKCGPNSRWSMSIAAVLMIGLSTMAGFGISSAIGLFFGPVHSLLPFVLLGIGVDDGFVIVNAFDRERGTKRRVDEDDEALVERCARGLARAGASVAVTSMTDLVAFAISSNSALPALASFCGFASICIAFLWFFASTFFTACLVLDEHRQRNNGRDCLCCCLTRKTKDEGDDDENNNNNAAAAEQEEETENPEGIASACFRKHHAPAILSAPGKAIVLTIFSGLLAFGLHGSMNLSVENTERNFVPADSYILEHAAAADEWFSEDGTSFFIVFEEVEAQLGNAIYDKRQALAQLDERLAGKSTAPPYISEPISEDACRNVMTGLEACLVAQGTDAVGGAPVGSDGWPATQEDFVSTLEKCVSFIGPGSQHAGDVSMVTDMATNQTRLEAIRVESECVRLTKERRGEIIEDASKQIDAMDATRAMVDSWTDLPPSFVHSNIYLGVEGFKIVRSELFMNVGLAIVSVAIIVLFAVASFMTALLITLNVAFCIVEILGFMWAIGIAIDSVSVINVVLAVGLSVDCSAHVGHTFMVKGGSNWNRRVTETLVDMGAAVLCGATSTFLAVAVLLGSSSHVFEALSTQFALTVALGVSHGLILLPVMLSLVGPKPFASAENLDGSSNNNAVATSEDSDEQGDTNTNSKCFETTMSA